MPWGKGLRHTPYHVPVFHPKTQANIAGTTSAFNMVAPGITFPGPSYPTAEVPSSSQLLYSSSWKILCCSSFSRAGGIKEVPVFSSACRLPLLLFGLPLPWPV